MRETQEIEITSVNMTKTPNHPTAPTTNGGGVVISLIQIQMAGFTNMNYSRRIAEHLGTINRYYMDGKRCEDYPRYEESLDEIHKAEELTIRSLGADERYAEELTKIAARGNTIYTPRRAAITAKAAHRAEALCNTLGI